MVRNIFVMGLLWGLKWIIYVNNLEKCLVYRNLLKNFSCCCCKLYKIVMLLIMKNIVIDKYFN